MALSSSYWIHHIDPVVFKMGPLSVHWYGLMYMVGFLCFYFLGCRRLRHDHFQQKGWSADWVEDFLSYGIMGVILGGRLGYVLFYKPAHFWNYPQEIVQVWHGGMSFHGGLIGVIIAFIIFARKTGRPFLEIADFVAPLVPTGLGAGRLGNFINGELWGHPTQAPWAVIFPQVDRLPRHPSQLYEFVGEGLVLFALLWWAGQQKWAQERRGRIAALFLIGYGLIRMAIERFRESDLSECPSWLPGFIAKITTECFREPAHFLAGGLTMGQWLCVPMVLAGIVLWWYAPRADQANSLPQDSMPPKTV